MKKRSLLILLFLVPMLPTVTILPMIAPAEAWGLQTHMFIDSKAITYLSNESWQDAFEYYAPEVLGGSTTPDQAWQDWDNHLYYPETGEYNAPWAAEKWFNYARDNFTAAAAATGETAQQLWETGFFSAGVLSHYAADPCIPVHTDDVEDEIPDMAWPGHSAYETEINSKLDFLSITVTNPETEITNVTEMVIDNAIYSHQYFDLIADAYPDGDSTALTNSSVLTATQNCLSLAVTSIAQLFYTLTLGIDAPDVTITYKYVALFDYAHTNDYSDGSLTSVNQTLVRHHFEMRTQDSAITSAALADVDLLIVTCGFDSYTNDELTAISDWTESGNKSIIVTSRGDFSDITSRTPPNQILQSIGSNIRVTDDNVYMLGTYQPWYDDLTTIPDSADTLGLTQDVSTLTLYSPTSLYFIDEGPVLPIIYADATGYQTDQNPPTAEVIYDDTQDSLNGGQIPLIAIEELGEARLLVAGTTFFSDFDYGKTTFDNVNLFENFLDWAVGNRSISNIADEDEMGPKISDISVDMSGTNFTVTATIEDVSGIQNATVIYDSTSYPMRNSDGDTYTVTFEGNSANEYTMMSFDTVGNKAIRTPLEIVPSSTTPSTTTTTTTSIPITGDGVDYTLIIIGAGVGVVLILVIVIYMKRK